MADIPVTFRRITGSAIDGYSVSLGLEECSACFCAVSADKRKEHLAWHDHLAYIGKWEGQVQRYVDANPKPKPRPEPAPDFGTLINELFSKGTDQA